MPAFRGWDVLLSYVVANPRLQPALQARGSLYAIWFFYLIIFPLDIISDLNHQNVCGSLGSVNID